MSGTVRENLAVEYLRHIEADDLEFFAQFDTILDEAVVRASREFPADFYEDLKKGVLTSLMSVIGGGRLTVKLVVDTNIVLGDAFRVAKGRPSSTERLMGSKFVKLVSPTDITREARERVVSDLPKGASLKTAQAQVERLLAQITIISGTSEAAFRRAQQQLKDRDIGDAPFLAVLIDTGGEGIVSRDREAFESLEGVKRWELGEMANLVNVYESGTLALALTAATTELLYESMSKLVETVVGAILQAFSIFASIIVGLATGAADALSRVPGWAWAVLGVAGVAVGIMAIIDEDFREWLLTGLSSIADVLFKAAKSITAAAVALARAIKEFLLWIWKIVEPAVIAAGKASLVGAGVMYRMILLLIEECNRAVDVT
ncbi:MAG: PIN domain-containing protein [Thermoplasmata archaeon]